MKDAEYWKQRFKQMEEAQNDTSIRKAQEIQEKFDRSLAAIDGKINAWYQRLANNNGVSMQEARRMLDKGELKEFKWNVEDYIKYAEENEISGAWAKQLENASARVHISRLEALKIETQHEMEKLYGNCVDAVDEHIRGVYTSDFYHTAYEIQKGIGVGSNIQKLNPDAVEKIICKPWAVDEKNFSDRLWESKTKLINNVHNSLSRMCITGEPPDRAIKEIAKEMNVSKAQASRVVMTESAAFANKARQDCMKELNVEEFEVVETLDSHTCGTCGDMDGKHYPMSEFQIGVTAPPFHPNCRGCTCPYFNDEFTKDEERAARGADGKTYYVPADMTYNEWKDFFVETPKKSDIIKEIKIPREIRNATGITTDILNSMQKGIDVIENEYDIRLSKILVENLGNEKPDTPYFCRYIDNDGMHEAVFVVNSGFDFSGFEDVVSEGYRVGYFAGKNIEDHIIHEMAHVMTGQHIQNSDEFSDFMKTIEKEYVPGVSGYSDIANDGFETIAEAFVRLRNGEEVPEKAKELVETYIERWRK